MYTDYTHVYVHTCNIILDTIYIHIKKQYTWVLYASSQSTALNTNLDLGTHSTLLNYTYLGRN